MKQKSALNKKKSFLKTLWGMRAGYLFCLPLFALMVVFCYYPPISGLRLSFFEQTSTSEAVFVGFKNFADIFSDKVFTDSIGTMFILMVPKLIIGIVMPFIAAELIFAVKSDKLQNAYRVLMLLPIVAPGVVSLMIWKNIYDPEGGILIAILRAFRIVGENTTIDWLNDPDWVIFSIIFMGFPWVGGTSVLIYMSGLMNISSEVIEASRLDGASTFRRIWSIDIPNLVGQIRYFLIFGIIGGFQDYGTQVVLTHGGPGYSTYVPGYYMWELAYTFDNIGRASAVGTLLFLIIIVFTVIANFTVKQREDV